MESRRTDLIILIDDDESFNFVCELSIRKVLPGSEIQSFKDPVMGLQFVVDRIIPGKVNATVFLDINMPLFSGWDILEKLYAFSNSLPTHTSIYMLSSSIDATDRLKSEQHPMVTGYLQKPLYRDTLESIFRIKKEL